MLIALDSCGSGVKAVQQIELPGKLTGPKLGRSGVVKQQGPLKLSVPRHWARTALET